MYASILANSIVPHEGLAQEVHIAQRCVQVVVLFLFGSIIFVVCAFSTTSIAIVPNQEWQSLDEFGGGWRAVSALFPA